MKFKKLLKPIYIYISTPIVCLSSVSLVTSCSACRHILTDELLSLYPGSIAPGALWKCSRCGKGAIGPNPFPSEINMPCIYINGDFSNVSKQTKTKMQCMFINPLNNQYFEADCTVKLQGNGSITLPKKSYNIQFFEKNTSFETKKKVTLKDSWTSESKYTLKCNWIGGQLRNIISCIISGNVVKTIDDGLLSKLPNGGCSDGVPTIVYINDTFNGVYTINIPKDKQMFKSLDGTVEPAGIIASNCWNDTTRLLKHVDSNFSNGLENEFCSTDDPQWMVDSFNNLIDFNLNTDDETFKANVSTYFALDRAIDFLVLIHAFNMVDNSLNNVVYVTFDRTKWIPVLYDMDKTMGLDDDCNLLKYNAWFEMGQWNTALIFRRIYNLYFNEIKSRYLELRQSVLKIENINNVIDNFNKKFTKLSLNSELERWPGLNDQKGNSAEWIKSWLKQRLEWLDQEWSK